MIVTVLLIILGILVLLIASTLLFFYFAQDYTAPIPPAAPGTIRVACVGDSITYGTLVWDRRKNCYPAQLQNLLGEKYSVRNFGANGRTMQKDTDRPYWKHKNFALSSEFNPDIVLLMLGTNDSKTHNWKDTETFIRDYREMLEHYRSLPSKPIVYLMTPAKAFIIRGRNIVNYNMSDMVIDEISAAIKLLATQENVDVIDIHAATALHSECFRLDGIHPNAAGAKIIAESVYEALKETPGNNTKTKESK
jgi:lysophospholipase L1-like esterase